MQQHRKRKIFVSPKKVQKENPRITAEAYIILFKILQTKNHSYLKKMRVLYFGICNKSAKKI